MYDDIIDRYWYSIDWDVPTIWALDLPVHEISVDRLVWHMDAPVWCDASGVPYQTTPNQVLQNFEENWREYDRILKVDLRYPIEIFQLKQRLMILDGIHRLACAIMLGHDNISVRFVPEDAIQKL